MRFGLRLLALSVVIFAGSFLASAGVIAESLPGARTRNYLDVYGLLLVAFGCLLLVIEWVAGLFGRLGQRG